MIEESFQEILSESAVIIVCVLFCDATETDKMLDEVFENETGDKTAACINRIDSRYSYNSLATRYSRPFDADADADADAEGGKQRGRSRAVNMADLRSCVLVQSKMKELQE